MSSPSLSDQVQRVHRLSLGLAESPLLPPPPYAAVPPPSANLEQPPVQPESAPLPFDHYCMVPESELQVFSDSSRIGGGSFGEVFGALWLGLPVVVKRLYFMFDDAVAINALGGPLSVEARRETLDQFHRECAVLCRLKHPNLVLLLGVACDAARQARFLVLEFVRGVSLETLIHPDGRNPGEPLDQERALGVVLDIARALAYLHSRCPPVLHLDVRPASILIDALGRAKLSDLGESRIVFAARRFSGAAPLPRGVAGLYMAPELESDDEPPSAKSDMFSLGVVAAEIGSGLRPNPGPATKKTGPRSLVVVDEEERRAADIAAVQHAPLQNLVQALILHESQQRLDALQVLAQFAGPSWL